MKQSHVSSTMIYLSMRGLCVFPKGQIMIVVHTASICSPSSTAAAGHQPFKRLESNSETVSIFLRACSPTPGIWCSPHFLAFLDGFGILFKFNSSWPGNKTMKLNLHAWHFIEWTDWALACTERKVKTMISVKLLQPKVHSCSCHLSIRKSL